ncbi:MAG: dihydrofolate reductase [Bacteroidaceae bacterium]
MTRFADIEILHYDVPQFEKLPITQKQLIYCLNEAALWGRDIFFDQNGEYNLLIRKVLESIYLHYQGDRSQPDFNALTVYLQRVWCASGIHHHYGMMKFNPGFSQDDFLKLIKGVPAQVLPQIESVQNSLNKTKIVSNDLNKGALANVTALWQLLAPIICDPTIVPKRVNQSAGQDLLLTSACNYYADGITQQEAMNYYASLKGNEDHSPSYGLNSRLIRNENRQLEEEIYSLSGRYATLISKIVYWLDQAKKFVENKQQEKALDLLIAYYQNGDLKTWDEYSIEWVKDTDSVVDFINGFIETYGDPIGLKGSWEALVNYKDEEATQLTKLISDHAKWFEDHSPVNPDYKKKEVKGVTAKVITAAILAGDLYPTTAIGINLPNANWIRSVHGSKSVSLSNITKSYHDAAKGNGFLAEYVLSDSSLLKHIEKYGSLTDNLHTDLHECVGHGSGRLLPGVSEDALLAHGATIEEARADLFGLYFMADEKMVELGLLPDVRAYEAAYYTYMMNGLMTQLIRIEPGEVIEESHMRNRQLIAKWVYEKGLANQVVSIVSQKGKHYVKISDYHALRLLFGELLAEIQRIKSTGDYQAACQLVEKYAIEVDLEMHTEVLERYKALNLAPYKGFVNPVYERVGDDVHVRFNEEYNEQMLRYSNNYSI